MFDYGIYQIQYHVNYAAYKCKDKLIFKTRESATQWLQDNGFRHNLSFDFWTNNLEEAVIREIYETDKSKWL